MSACATKKHGITLGNTATDSPTPRLALGRTTVAHKPTRLIIPRYLGISQPQTTTHQSIAHTRCTIASILCTLSTSLFHQTCTTVCTLLQNKQEMTSLTECQQHGSSKHVNTCTVGPSCSFSGDDVFRSVCVCIDRDNGRKEGRNYPNTKAAMTLRYGYRHRTRCIH